MRAILSNFGSLGDVYPLLALAIELRRHGHQPVLALSPGYASWAERFDLDLVDIGPDVQQELRDIIAGSIQLTEFYRTPEAIRSFFDPVMKALPHIFDDLEAACRGADVLISGPTQPAARMVHEMAGIPFVSLFLVPYGVVGSAAMQRARFSFINPFREQLGLEPLRDPMTSFDSSQLTLYAISRHVVPPATTWPPHYHATGYFFGDDGDWQPPAALADFCAGERPVVITFGSMVHEDSEGMTDLLLEAVRRAGCRAVIQQRWGELARRSLPPNVLPVEYASYGWLFPRAACIVHHCGSGTGGWVFRSGVPSVCVPHTTDHPFWAQVTHELGCAGPPIPVLELTSERLAEAISATLTNPAYHQTAAEIGVKIRAEQGTARARELIEMLVSQAGPRGTESAAARSATSRSDRRRNKADRRKQYQQQRRSKKDRERE